MCNVSGLALGVDCIAQKAAIEAGRNSRGGRPNELPDISPRTNYQLAMSIIEQGRRGRFRMDEGR